MAPTTAADAPFCAPLDPRFVFMVPDERLAVPGGLRRVLKAHRVARRGPGRPPTKDEVNAERPFWGKHPDPDLAFAEDEFYRVGFTFLADLLGHALGRSAPRRLQKAYAVAPRRIPGWGAVADLFASDADPEHLMRGWEAVIDRLVAGLFPGHSQEQAAQGLALRTHLLHRAGQRVAAPSTLPSWGEALRTLGDSTATSMQWTKVRGLQFMKGLEAQARAGLLKTLVASKEAGEGSQQLQRRCFERFSELNKDWRRVALTESALAASNGALASVEPAEGWLAEWIAGPNACPFCKRQGGHRFRVVSPDAPSKNGQTQVWAGKHNVGRSASPYTQDGTKRTEAELWWPVVPAHPNCACSWAMRRVKPATP